jgi:hypothetical protein
LSSEAALVLRDVEQVARSSGLYLLNDDGEWTANEDYPHIATFSYQLARYEAETDLRVPVGAADGYRIAQDWTVESDLELWDEADAVDGDVVRYVEALIRELRACEHVFDMAPELTNAQRITIVRHVEPTPGVDSADLTQGAVAALAMMDAPVLMLVDPWPMASERRASAGRLRGRSHIPKLLELGFVRMVGSRFLWAWNRELSDNLMADYSYDALLEANRKGALDEILKTSLSQGIYGPLPDDVAELVDVPKPNDFTED